MSWAAQGLIGFSGLLILLSGCAQRPVTPDSEAVKVTREKPSDKCQEIGLLKGSTLTMNESANSALMDLKREAARKGANYIMVKQYSDNETSVTGIAYDCP